MLHRCCVYSSKTWRLCSCPQLLASSLGASTPVHPELQQRPKDYLSTALARQKHLHKCQEGCLYNWLRDAFLLFFVFKGNSHRERSKLRDEPWLYKFRGSDQWWQFRSGSATAEMVNSGAGAVKGDWRSTELVQEEAAKDQSLMALSHEVTAWLNMGFEYQFWHPTELPPSEIPIPKMSLAHTCLMLLSPRAAPALLHVCNLH